MFIVIVVSCKKDNNTDRTNETTYPIGTTLSISKNSPNFIQDDSTLRQVKNFTIKDKSISWISPGDGGDTSPHKNAAIGPYLVRQIALSNNNIYSLYFQMDGNLVLYKTVGGVSTALWASENTVINNGPGGSRVTFQADGNIVHILSNSNPLVTWAANKFGGPNPIWILQDDGNLVGYSNHTLGYNNVVTITGTSFGTTGTQGGNKSSHFGKIR